MQALRKPTIDADAGLGEKLGQLLFSCIADY